MRHFVPLAAAFLFAQAVRAAEPPKDQPKPQTPEQQYKHLVQSYDRKVREFQQAMSKAKTPEEVQKLLKEMRPPDRAEYARKLLKLAEDNPKSDFAPDALAWVVNIAGFGPSSEKARKLLFHDYIKSKALAQITVMLGDMPSPENIKLLRRIIRENPHHQVQGEAHFALGEILVYYQEKAKDKEAEKQFEKVVKDYGDVKTYRGALAQLAKSQLFELQHLAIGMVAPNIVGTDADGKKFQLTGYRGKVVVLDFWAEW
jgi:hypothetical protein